MINIINNCGVKNVKKYFRNIKKILQMILDDFKKSNYEINLLICDNTFIQKLNKDYRGKDYPTDVLSFSQIESIDENYKLPILENVLGDIAISFDKASEQASENNVSIEEELARLSIHGILHLLGFDHERSEKEEEIMREKEDYYLNFLTTHNKFF